MASSEHETDLRRQARKEASGHRHAGHSEKNDAADPVFEIQRHAGNQAMNEAVRGLLHEGEVRSSGDPLDKETREFFEPRLGVDLDQVRVHQDPEAADSARAIDAHAYTAGEHIVFNAGAYAPHSTEGRRLLAHELAHVAQNKRSPSRTVRRQDAGGDKFDKIAQQVFHRTDYADFLAQDLESTTFLGRQVSQVHHQMTEKLKEVEKNLTKSQGANYQAPSIGSTLRSRASMHGFGMAIDFDVLENPYVLNEAGEAQLDQQLIVAYDHIAQFMLGKTRSDINKLQSGRSGFSANAKSPAPVDQIYDSLREESDAMRRYFLLKNNATDLTTFLANEWPAKHPGQTAPGIAAVQAQMQDDYEVLGGKTASGSKRPTAKGQGDRPFAPTSGGGKGDPATGFLNLPKEFVVAMTDAGFAWGAVDFAGGKSGDMQHFDLRLIGTGHTVAHMLGAV
jgi:hypothetical protein